LGKREQNVKKYKKRTCDALKTVQDGARGHTELRAATFHRKKRASPTRKRTVRLIAVQDRFFCRLSVVFGRANGA
jgi:hypothetical protein